MSAAIKIVVHFDKIGIERFNEADIVMFAFMIDLHRHFSENMVPEMRVFA